MEAREGKRALMVGLSAATNAAGIVGVAGRAGGMHAEATVAVKG